jgi:hypothetical protein
MNDAVFYTLIWLGTGLLAQVLMVVDVCLLNDIPFEFWIDAFRDSGVTVLDTIFFASLGSISLWCVLDMAVRERGLK